MMLRKMPESQQGAADAPIGPLDIGEFWTAVRELDVVRLSHPWTGVETRVDDLASASDVGNSRQNNEDAHLIWRFLPAGDSRALTIMVVADGVGGAQAGEVASNMAVKTIAVELFRLAFQRTAEIGHPWAMTESDLKECIVRGHQIIQREADRRGLTDEMTSTVVVAALMAQKLRVAHAGDSRAYVFSKQGLRRATQDHTFVMDLIRNNKITPEAARRHPLRHVITQAVGKSDDIEPESTAMDMAPSDEVLLCTDGLTDMLDDSAIEAVFRKTPLVTDQARELIQQTLQSGGKDNITVALANSFDRPAPTRPALNESILTVCQFGRSITYRFRI